MGHSTKTDEMVSRQEDLSRITEALQAAVEVVRQFTPGPVDFRLKDNGDPVTDADQTINQALMEQLLAEDEGWLSEETADNLSRLEKRRVWIVDPLDGTREFIEGIPEWCISVGLVEDGIPVAGGICNPIAGETVLGAIGLGVTLNGQPITQEQEKREKDMTVLASRSEVERGEWEQYAGAPFNVIPMGSVAYKLARVAAGLNDATWTLVPKNEWDVAAGVALITAAGGFVCTPDGKVPTFNQSNPLMKGLLAFSLAARQLRNTVIPEWIKD